MSNKFFSACSECDRALEAGEDFCPDHPNATVLTVVDSGAKTTASDEHSEYPEDLTGESAFYALDGPREQVMAELARIADLCSAHAEDAPSGWDGRACRQLEAEAREYLAEMRG